VKRGKKNGPRLLETPLLSPWLFADAAEEWGIAVAEAGHWNLLIVSSGREVPNRVYVHDKRRHPGQEVAEVQQKR
jgi:hypothetical protein